MIDTGELGSLLPTLGSFHSSLRLFSCPEVSWGIADPFRLVGTCRGPFDLSGRKQVTDSNLGMGRGGRFLPSTLECRLPVISRVGSNVLDERRVLVTVLKGSVPWTRTTEGHG